MNPLRCRNCGKEKTYKPSGKQKDTYTGLCRTCFGISQSGSGNPRWIGGRVKDGRGYIRVKIPNHPFANKNGYAAEHRVIAAKKWGIDAVINMVVHHKDGDRANNHPDNLELFTISNHSGYHRNENSTRRKIGELNPLIECECGCGIKINKFSKHGDPRRFIVSHWSRKNV